MYLYYSCAIYCEPHYLLLIGMRASVLQQNFHGASNMPFEELCLVGVICLFSLLFITALSSAHAHRFLITFPVRPEIRFFVFGRLYGAG
jgi:hypothetical protein